MPRKPVRYVVFILCILGVIPPFCIDSQARPTNFPTGLVSGDSDQVENQADSSELNPVVAAEDSTLLRADTAASDTVILEPVLYVPGTDTLLIKQYHSQDTSKGTVGSPTVNLFKSVIFPGWGQYGNRKYIKAGVILAVESYFIYKAIDNGRQASDWHDRWREAPSELKNLYFSEYTDYRDRRNTFIWYTALTVFLSMFDAYVDAHLQNFPQKTSDTESVSIEALPGGETRLTFSYNF